MRRGLRKKNKVDDSIEFYSSVRTYKVINDCDIAILMIDSQSHFNKQDKEIASYIIGKGKGLIVVINKWDLIEEKDTNTMRDMKDDIIYGYSDLQHYPIKFISINNFIVKKNRKKNRVIRPLHIKLQKLKI